LAELAAYDFTLKYKAGVCNIDADTLSQLAHNPELTREEEQEITSEAVHTISSSLHCPVVETHCLSAEALDSMDDKDESQYKVHDVR
jgi:hypothetical protein